MAFSKIRCIILINKSNGYLETILILKYSICDNSTLFPRPSHKLCLCFLLVLLFIFCVSEYSLVIWSPVPHSYTASLNFAGCLRSVEMTSSSSGLSQLSLTSGQLSSDGVSTDGCYENVGIVLLICTFYCCCLIYISFFF